MIPYTHGVGRSEAKASRASGFVRRGRVPEITLSGTSNPAPERKKGGKLRPLIRYAKRVAS